jgi:nickel transport protein
LFLLWVLSGPAWAHKVSIFAWVEGDTVYTQSKFSTGRPVKNAMVVVYDDQGRELLHGETNETGAFSFLVPQRTPLTVSLKASMGHSAHWRLSADDLTDGPLEAFPGSASKEMPAVTENFHDKGSPLLKSPQVGNEPRFPASSGLSEGQVKAIVDEALDKKLAPIMRILAEHVDRGPTVGDVISGLGYIIGLMGVALYVSYRRREK